MDPVAESSRSATCGAGRKGVLALALCLTVSGCGLFGGRVQSPRALNPDDIADAVPAREPLSPYGNPESYVVGGHRYYTLRTAKGYTERGVASWYGNPFHGRRTSSGEVYDMYRMTAAHKLLPLPSYVQVRNLDNGRLATVKVNDRGPFKDNRVIDLSYAAALKLGVVGKGTAFVELRAIDESGALSAAPAAALVGVVPAPVTVQPAPATPPQAATAPMLKPAPAAALLPVPPAASGMYIQVGAYADRRNAERVSAAVAKAVATKVEIREIKSNNKVFYRVQLGPLTSTEVADEVVSALEKIGITQHYFMTN